VGILLDSTVFIAAERKGSTARQALADVSAHFPGEHAALSVLTLLELAHGASRADTPARKAMRQRFLSELITAIPVFPVTAAVALRAGRIDGETAAAGIRLALSDLLIGVTALELGYTVVTANSRHFQSIPGLRVIPF
jgi:tRNA(fMet)-specific endonuclease VapC